MGAVKLDDDTPESKAAGTVVAAELYRVLAELELNKLPKFSKRRDIEDDVLHKRSLALMDAYQAVGHGGEELKKEIWAKLEAIFAEQSERSKQDWNRFGLQRSITVLEIMRDSAREDYLATKK